MRQTLSFQPSRILICFGYRWHKALGWQGSPSYHSINHHEHKWQRCPVIPQLSYFTVMWFGSKKLLKCFHLTMGFPFGVKLSPFIMMKQNSVDRALALSPNFLLNHPFFFLVGVYSHPGHLHVTHSDQAAGRNTTRMVWMPVYTTHRHCECGSVLKTF